jgi:tRNA(Ile)-lysidine synthetase-like protein
MLRLNEITDLLEELYNEWFANKSFWFEKNEKIDKYLVDKFFILSKNINFFNINLDYNNKKQIIGAIIALDQIPRHAKRLYDNITTTYYTELAVKISKAYLNVIYDNELIRNNISAIEWCFILLPIRHSNDYECIIDIIYFIINKHNNTDNDNDRYIYKRYIQATVKNVYKNITYYYYIMQQKCNNKNIGYGWKSYSSVLENCPLQPIIYDIKCKDFIKNIDYINVKNIIVSFSGGVDSTLMLFLTKVLLPNKNIIAVHIDYNNRDENEIELKFVEQFCNNIGVKLYYRIITELRRKDCHKNGLRSIYENLTHDIRFDMYRQVANNHFGNEQYVVALGHNKDDCFENIITNISLKKNYDDLSGMTTFSTNDNICFWRPFLDIEKDKIIEYANTINLPYLKNSTPIWSARGKIRNQILPAMQDINKDIINSFFTLKDFIVTQNKLIDDYIIQKMINKPVICDNNITYNFDNINDLICDLTIWNKVMIRLNIGHISQRSLKEFIEYLNRFRVKYESMQRNVKMKFVLNKNVYACLHKKDDGSILLNFFYNK